MIGKFHHLGFACKSINQESKFFEDLGYNCEGDIFEDINQGIRGVFMTGPGPRMELLENITGSNTLTPWINKGVQLYHQAFCVNDIDSKTDQLRGEGNFVVVHPVSAVAFEGRRIAFIMMRNRMLIELIETPS